MEMLILLQSLVLVLKSAQFKSYAAGLWGLLVFDVRDCSIEYDDGFYYPIIASIQQLASTTFEIISETTRLSRFSRQPGTECNGSECQCQITQ